jgi:hypothetical protein
VIDASRASAGRAVFLMFDDKTEELCRERGLEVMLPSAKLRTEIDDKISCTRIADRAGVASVPNVLAKVRSYAELREVSQARSRDRWSCRHRSAIGPHDVLHRERKRLRKHAGEITPSPRSRSCAASTAEEARWRHASRATARLSDR